jgi:drug/metabolite transporter (DMT)-like permease
MFSLAYVQLDTGVGAFILFVAVQLMLLLVARFTGQRLNKQQVLGALIAIAGLALLLLPNADGTYIGYAGLMLLAAMGWAMFVLLGKGSVAPLVDVSSAFVAATLLMFGLVFILSISMGQAFDVDWFSSAFFLAIISGAITSGVGYYLWYRVLPLIGVQKAAQLQLLVPVIATVMGSLVLGEVLTFIAVIASAVIVFGVWLFLVAVKK